MSTFQETQWSAANPSLTWADCVCRRRIRTLSRGARLCWNAMRRTARWSQCRPWTPWRVWGLCSRSRTVEASWLVNQQNLIMHRNKYTTGGLQQECWFQLDHINYAKTFRGKYLVEPGGLRWRSAHVLCCLFEIRVYLFKTFFSSSSFWCVLIVVGTVIAFRCEESTHRK